MSECFFLMWCCVVFVCDWGVTFVVYGPTFLLFVWWSFNVFWRLYVSYSCMYNICVCCCVLLCDVVSVGVVVYVYVYWAGYCSGEMCVLHWDV